MTVISIAASVLWPAKIGTRQKLTIGAFLVLSVFMVIIACIRIAGVHLVGPYGFTWQYFWLEIEACVAVIMVSVMAFRSFYVTQRPREGDRKAKPWYSSTVARLRRRGKNSGNHEVEDWPPIPSGTMTGMRTFIRGSRLGTGSEVYDDLTGSEPSKFVGQEVRVIQDIHGGEEVSRVQLVKS